MKITLKFDLSFLSMKNAAMSSSTRAAIDGITAEPGDLTAFVRGSRVVTRADYTTIDMKINITEVLRKFQPYGNHMNDVHHQVFSL